MKSNRQRKEKVGPYNLNVVWPDPPQETKDRVIEFWNANSALPENVDNAGQVRAQQLVIVAEKDDGEIAAVSTAFAGMIPQLGFPCFHYRTFVADKHRQLWVLSLDLFQASYAVLNDRFQEKHDPQVLGIFMELQNEGLNRQFKYAVWEVDGMNVVYIGKSPQGQHRRVWYFDGAKVP
jgi:hypothetical protein